jgi:hypothetical protein
MNVLTLVIAIAAWAQYTATNGQLKTMNRQLHEMRNSGVSATEQANRVINNMNWLSKEMHYSVQQSQAALEVSRRQSKDALDASIEISRTDQRAWIGITSPTIVAKIELRNRFISKCRSKTWVKRQHSI